MTRAAPRGLTATVARIWIGTDGRTTTHRADSDVFKGNWKQALDTDGDGFGDNHGVDICAVPRLRPQRRRATFSPTSRRSTWTRTATASATTIRFRQRGYCPFDYGESYRDRNGCLDSDGDGASDPSGEGTFLEWNSPSTVPMCGPLTARNGPTAMKPNGFGDNQSENATNPTDSRCVERLPTTPTRTAMQTTGPSITTVPTPKAFNSIRARPRWGNSTRRNLTVYAYGCPDSDGDGYTDSYVYDIDQSTGLRQRTRRCLPRGTNAVEGQRR